MQTFKFISAIMAAVIGTYAFLPYIKDILTKRTQPHTYSWLIWAITQGTAVAGLWYGGGGIAALELTIGVILVFFVFLLSLRFGTKNITMSDTVLLVLALAAIVVWWQLKNPMLAVIIVSMVDLFGCIPSMRKSWQEPWSETLSSWTLFSVGNIFAIIALNEYNLLTLTYIITITICNMAVLCICIWRRKKIDRPEMPSLSTKN